jgi:subtilisin-like proprotein convertase family protein
VTAGAAFGFADEMRVGLRGTVRRVWGRRGLKVRQRLQLQYEWRCLFLVVDRRAGKHYWCWTDSMAADEVVAAVGGIQEVGVVTALVLAGAGPVGAARLAAPAAPGFGAASAQTRPDADAPLIAAGTAATFAGTGGPITDALAGSPNSPQATSFTRTVNITTPGFTTVSDLNVRVNLTHPALNQLRIDLLPPNGLPQVTLLLNRTDAAGNSNTSIGASGANLVGTVFDQEAAPSITGNAGGAASTGHFRPEVGSLAAFNGLTAAQVNGTWTLRVTDFRNGSTGSLGSWELDFLSGNRLSSPVEGTPGVVASFVDTDPAGTASQFTATITWNNATFSTGAISANAGGGFDVSATHEEGVFPISVLIQDVGGASTTATGTVTVLDAPLVAASVPIAAVTGLLFNGLVATFQDTNPSPALNDFSATINWGDNTTSAGTVGARAGGGFNVTGAHTYAIPGHYSVLVQINDVGGSTASAVSPATVSSRVLLPAVLR